MRTILNKKRILLNILIAGIVVTIFNHINRDIFLQSYKYGKQDLLTNCGRMHVDN